MAKARHSVSVDRPIHEVFDFLAEGTNTPIWRPIVTLVARISGTGVGAGTRYVQRVSDGGGRTVEETYEITRFEPPHLLEFTVERGAIRTAGRYTLARIDPGTTHVEFTLWQLSPGLLSGLGRADGDRLREQVASIAGLPAAMRDQQQ